MTSACAATVAPRPTVIFPSTEHLAAANGHLNCAQLLLEHKCVGGALRLVERDIEACRQGRGLDEGPGDPLARLEALACGTDYEPLSSS